MDYRAIDAADDYRHVTAIAAGIHAGEEWALAELYERMTNGPLRNKVAVAFVARPNIGVMDVLHDAYLEAVIQIQQSPLTDGSRLMGFIKTIVYRQMLHEVGHLVQNRGSEDRSRYTDSRTPLCRLLNNELEAVVGRSLEQLRDKDKEILKRFYLQHQKPRQICREMQLSETQYRLAKSRAKIRFGSAARAHYSPARQEELVNEA